MDASNYPDHIGTSADANRVVHTLISPTKDEIEIPADFVASWKNRLAIQNYGWFKDPAGNYMGVDTTKVITQNYIPGGILISRHCGFHAPQKVILNYQDFDNQFNMRIVDDHDRDIIYYGFHFTVNYHATRLADPTFKPPLSFISLVTDDDSLEGSYELFKNLNVRDDDTDVILIADEYRPSKEAEPIPDVDANKEHVWMTTLSQGAAEGRQVLHFPQAVMDNFPFASPTHVFLVDAETNESFETEYKSMVRPNGKVARFMCKGWYTLARKLQLKEKDHMILTIQSPVDQVMFRVVRINVH